MEYPRSFYVVVIYTDHLLENPLVAARMNHATLAEILVLAGLKLGYKGKSVNIQHIRDGTGREMQLALLSRPVESFQNAPERFPGSVQMCLWPRPLGVPDVTLYFAVEQRAFSTGIWAAIALVLGRVVLYKVLRRFTNHTPDDSEDLVVISN